MENAGRFGLQDADTPAAARFTCADDADDAVRAIVLTGAGDAFCAGADLSSLTSPFDAPGDEDAFTASPINPAAFEWSTPVIAAVRGHAIGIGLTIALQADIRIMAADPKYAVPQVRRGVVPDCMAHWTLPRLAGTASRCLPAAEVLDHALSIARDIAVNVAPTSAALNKRLLWDIVINGDGPRQVADLETQLHYQVMGARTRAKASRRISNDAHRAGAQRLRTPRHPVAGRRRSPSAALVRLHSWRSPSRRPPPARRRRCSTGRWPGRPGAAESLRQHPP